MIVVVEWIDGEKRRYEGVADASPGADNVLRLYGPMTHGRRELIVSLPTPSIREWREVE